VPFALSLLLLSSMILLVLASNKHLAASSRTCVRYKHQATRRRQTHDHKTCIQLYGSIIPTVDAYISPEDREHRQKRVGVGVTLFTLEFVKKIGVATNDIRPRFADIVPESYM
jgi:hypothetical protein